MRSPSTIGRNLHVPRLSDEGQESSGSSGREDRDYSEQTGYVLTALTIAPTEALRRHAATSSTPSHPICRVALTKHPSYTVGKGKGSLAGL